MTRRLRGLLVVSLALNLGFITAIVTYQIRIANELSMDRPEYVLQRLIAVLPPADQDITRRNLEAAQPAMTAARQKFATQMQIARTGLGKQPYDADTVEAAINTAIKERTQVVGLLVDVFKQSLRAMSPDGRAIVARRRLAMEREP